ncbi:MAG: DASS family sodium-coupled anion symporter [Candidatus Gracilibacteria bacterium]|nr:DASS family sodium-coupled anion symporter [Candidatus Gracilibacteria bacterium]
MSLTDFRKLKQLKSLPRYILLELKNIEKIDKLRKATAHFNWKNIFIILLASVISVFFSLWLKSLGLAQETTYMGGIFMLSIILWSTEALPLFATAILIIFLEIIFLANPGDWAMLGFQNGDSPKYQSILSSFADPIIFLFLGGFILSQAIVKQGVDQKFAGILLKLFGTKPISVILGLMIVTAFLSMWMSNTATTAMMITLTIPLIAQIPNLDSLKKGLLLSIPIAANIGGMATPIGTPPNAVAIGFLKTKGIDIGFIDWMLVATPLMLILLFFSWILLWNLYKPKKLAEEVRFLLPENKKITKGGILVIVVFIITVLLWLTEKIHNIPSAVVALIPAVIFTAMGLTDRNDINSLDWNILLLIAGGIALGNGMQITHFSDFLIQNLPTSSSMIIILLGFATLGLSIIMSNTAAANIILPIAVGIAITLGGDKEASIVGVIIALSASLAMALPISTPPNAIAYSKGILKTSDFVKTGLIIGIVGLGIVLTTTRFLIEFWMK